MIVIRRARAADSWRELGHRARPYRKGNRRVRLSVRTPRPTPGVRHVPLGPHGGRERRRALYDLADRPDIAQELTGDRRGNE